MCRCRVIIHMVPKAFPYPIGVGTDICQVHRIASFLRRRDIRERWARRVFTRLEWPSLWRAFKRCHLSVVDRHGRTISKDHHVPIRKHTAYNIAGVWSESEPTSTSSDLPAAFRKHTTDAPILMGKDDMSERDSIWMLPDLSRFSGILNYADSKQYSMAISDAQSPLGNLARNLAGRFGHQVPSLAFPFLTCNADGQQKKQ